MSKLTNSRNGGRIYLCIAVIAMLVIGSVGLSNAEVNETVQQAYQLRIDGKLDEAKVMLEEYLANNPEDASAHYELARLNAYLITSHVGDLMESFAAAREEIDRAVEIEPENVIFNAFASQVTFLESYLALKKSQENAKEKIGQMAEGFESVITLDPDYGEVLLHLVEIYGGLPEEMGGNKEIAEGYAKILENKDLVLGAKARAIMMPEDADLVSFWKGILEKHPHDIDVMEEMGKVYLRQGDTDEGMKFLEAALAGAPEGNTILLDMARYYIMMLRMEQIGRDTAIPGAEDALERYLATEPIAPLKAYAIGLQSKLKFWTKQKEAGDKLVEQAEAIDAYFSKASAIPGPGLFVPPDELPHHHTWLFQPL
jgi:tetratricopeptide (TPR) repeat protein